MDHETGPPECEMPAPSGTGTQHTRHGDTSDNTGQPDNKPGTALVWIPCTRPPVRQDPRHRLKRRRDAAHRSTPLACSCRDPLWCDCRNDDDQLSDVQADAVIAAAETLAALGTPGIFDIEQCRAMWRRGARDLSVSSHRYATGGVT